MVQSRSQNPDVAILMAVYNGASHLREQLESIVAQEHQNWQVIASDDGSKDSTLDILSSFPLGSNLTVLEGPTQGVAENFMSLIRALPDHARPDSWLAFCDQDDIWLPDRISRGVTALSALPDNRPALYCSRTWITDEALANHRLSAPRPRPLGFRNALVQNVASGNTILLNAAGAQLACAAATEAGSVVVHDWWVYQIISGAGGHLLHDDTPTVLYRQHGVNQIGANDTMRARLKRMAMVFQGKFLNWNNINIAALNRSAHRLTPENRILLNGFSELRECGLFGRVIGLKRLHLYRQNTVSTLALWLSALLGRL